MSAGHDRDNLGASLDAATPLVLLWFIGWYLKFTIA